MPNTHFPAATLLRDTPLPLPLARIDRPREESAAARRAQHDARSVVAPEAGRLIIVSNRPPTLRSSSKPPSPSSSKR